jgi:hypothetical protein
MFPKNLKNHSYRMFPKNLKNHLYLKIHLNLTYQMNQKNLMCLMILNFH